MKSRSIGRLVCLALLATAATAFAEKPWTEVRSPHFRVLTNGSDSDARKVAREFEQMRYVFAALVPSFQLESGAPLTIFAARDEYTARELEPMMRHMKSGQLGGIFHDGWEKKFVMVRLDIPVELTTNQVVYHEYAHSILHLNAHWLPKWLDEGMAEFYGNTRFEPDKIYVGAPSPRVYALNRTPIPVEDLMTPRKLQQIFQDPEKTDVFYAESWALVHYLAFGPNMGLGAKLNQFFTLIQNGTPQKQAFQQVFGSFASVDKGLDQYMRRFSFKATVLKNPPQINEKTFTTKKLTLAQTYAELAGYHLWTHDLVHAQPLVDKALKADPNLGFAHEEQGFLLFSKGKDAAASDEFSQAYKLDPTLYLSLFAKTMLSPAASLKTAEDQKQFEAAMTKVAAVNLQFAPAYVQLARLAVRQGNLQQAFGLSRRAEELEPWRAGYHLLTGQILLRMGKYSQATQFAQYVAKNWTGPDRDEAIALWNRIPVANRPAGATIADEVPSGTQSMDGTVQSVQCPAPGLGKSIQPGVFTLLHEGHPQAFLMNGPIAFGFSDTLWWGEDHASMCHHLEGLHAIVRYRPATKPGYVGEIAEVSVLNQLPEPDVAHAKNASDTPAKPHAQFP